MCVHMHKKFKKTKVTNCQISISSFLSFKIMFKNICKRYDKRELC